MSFWWFFRERIKAISRNPYKYNYFLRICRRQTELISICNELNCDSSTSEDDLLSRIIEHLLENGSGQLSIYGVNTADPLEPSHALAVISESIAQGDFINRKKTSCSRSYILFPIKEVQGYGSIRRSPKNNLNFFPADCQHHDISIKQVREFARWILNKIRTKSIKMIFVNSDIAYPLFARIAYSSCVARYGDLSGKAFIPQGRDGKKLTAVDQISTLRFLTRSGDLFDPTKT